MKLFILSWLMSVCFAAQNHPLRNRPELFEREAPQVDWKNPARVRALLEKIRAFEFKRWNHLPDQPTLMTNLQSRFGLYELLEAGLPFGPGDRVRRNYLTRKNERKDVLLEIAADLFENYFLYNEEGWVPDWKKAFPEFKPYLDEILSVKSSEMSHHLSKANALVRYLDLFNVKSKIVKDYRYGGEKKAKNNDVLLGYRVEVQPSQAFLAQHWVSLLVAKMAQLPEPVTVSFATHQQIAAISNLVHSHGRSLQIVLPLVSAISPYAPTPDLEAVLYEIEQMQTTRTWPTQIVAVTPDNILPVYTLASLLKAALFSHAAAMAFLGGEFGVGGSAKTYLEAATKLSRSIRGIYEKAIEHTEDLEFRRIETGPQTALWDWQDDSSGIRLYVGTPDRQAVIKELVRGYAWVLDYEELLTTQMPSLWIEEQLECSQLFALEAEVNSSRDEF